MGQWDTGMGESKTGKKTSLGDIVTEFCRIGMKSLRFVGNFDQNQPEIDQNSPNFDQNSVEIDHSEPDFLIRKQIESIQNWENNISTRENRLIMREEELYEQAEYLRKETIELYETKAEFLEQKLHEQQTLIDGVVESRMTQDRTKQELVAKKEQLSGLQDEIASLRKQLQQPEKKKETIMDKLMPFLPSIISVVGMFMMYQKLDQKHDPDLLKEEVIKAIKAMSEKEQKELQKTK